MIDYNAIVDKWKKNRRSIKDLVLCIRRTIWNVFANKSSEKMRNC